MFLSNSLFCCIADIAVKLAVLPVGRHQRTSKQFLDNYQKSFFFFFFKAHHVSLLYVHFLAFTSV